MLTLNGAAVSRVLNGRPTNHLDLHAVVWLEEYLKNYDKTLVVVSHAREFLNEVATDILQLHDRSIVRYKGNFDAFESKK